MCGIAGYYIKGSLRARPDDIVKMTRTLRHRGPDDEGFTLINTKTQRMLNLSSCKSDKSIQTELAQIEDQPATFPHDLAISHRRYSIVDLTPAGHQPMWDKQGFVCISFNGEILFINLRK